jgi:hypothetical protein
VRNGNDEENIASISESQLNPESRAKPAMMVADPAAPGFDKVMRT